MMVRSGFICRILVLTRVLCFFPYECTPDDGAGLWDETLPAILPIPAVLPARTRCVQGDCRNSVGRTPSRWRAARYWVLIISLIFVGLEIPTRATCGVVSSSASTVMVP